MEENRKNFLGGRDELLEDLRMWVRSEARYVHIKPCEVIMCLGKMVNDEAGFSDFLYNDKVCVADLHSLERWLCKATPENVARYKNTLKALQEPIEFEVV